jgi:DNA-binding CsgD family transcriptional regulator
MYAQQAIFGYNAGVAFALHMPRGFHFMVGVDRDKPLPIDATERGHIVTQLQLLAVYAQEAAVRVLWHTTELPMPPKLTARELECLRWTMEGKTAWELGRILGISEQTVAKHVNNATHKLSCVSKHQAVVRAMRLGLLS